MGSGSVLLPHLFDENSNMSPLSMILNPLLITLPCHIIAGLKGRLRSVGYPCSMISQLLGFRRRAPDCCMWRSPPAPHKASSSLPLWQPNPIRCPNDICCLESRRDAANVSDDATIHPHSRESGHRLGGGSCVRCAKCCTLV